MSYLDPYRLTFAGLFEADVNTVNNDVRNFDSRVFEPRFQTPQVTEPDGRVEFNGWWNPAGSNNFRLFDCKVTGAGPDDSEPSLLRLAVSAQHARTSAKIIDLDPQFQFSSTIWGMRIALMDGDQVVMSANLTPTPFRDIFFSRLTNQATGKPVGGSNGASAVFTGTLEAIVWDPLAVINSILLGGLQKAAEANEGRLSISLMTYAYRNTPVPGALYGRVVGAIGNWKSGDPLTFARGRRLAPTNGSVSPAGIGFMNANLTPHRDILSLDFGMSLPMVMNTADPTHPVVSLKDLGPLKIVVLNQDHEVTSNTDGSLTLTACGADDDRLKPDQYEEIGTVEHYASAEWLQATAGIADLRVPTAVRALTTDRPIAILWTQNGEEAIAIRETVAGLWVRADNFLQRVDTVPRGWGAAEVSLYAMRFGLPYMDAPLKITLQERQEGAGGSSPTAVRPPQTDIPPINVPADKISLPPSLKTGADGLGVLTYQALDPENPRGYIDGQIYQFDYSFNARGQSLMPPFEFIAAHIRDAYVAPPTPSWASDIAPILVQYGNLYPVMSRGLFSFSDYETVAQNARLLYLAFTLPIADPNYMPATRDLSASKLRMLIDWLAGYVTGAAGNYGALPAPIAGSTLVSPSTPVLTGTDHPTHLPGTVARAALAALGDGNDGKTTAMREFLERSLAVNP